MPRITKVEDLLFPVEEHPVFVMLPKSSGKQKLQIPNKKAIVNTRTNRVLGIVSREYRLVTNQEALDLASECCRAVFPETMPGEWKVSASDAPATGGHCYLDLVHNSAKLNFEFVSPGNRPEEFGPFIRVINSYNGLRALSFNIGFYRKTLFSDIFNPYNIW